MRKLICALVAMFAIAGLVAAAEVNFVKFDAEKKELTVKEGDKESTYTISDKVKITSTDKDGNDTDVKLEDFTDKQLKKINAKKKYDITVDDKTITVVKYKSKK
jgi:hypothetical protein